MQGLDTTIVNVALPHIRGSTSASQDQISWVLTSYIVSAAIATPLVGSLADRLGIKYLMLGSVIGFTLASALCGAATNLSQLVLYRGLQGVCSAGLVPLGQTTLYRVYPRERHGFAMAIFATGAMMGPIAGPILGGWLTQDLGWRWCFYINLPVGALCALGVFVFIPYNRGAERGSFDMFGFVMLSIAVGALQLMLDRGEINDWFQSTEIRIEAAISALCFYLFIVHTVTTDGRSFLSLELLKNVNFVAGSLLMFTAGVILSGSLALVPSMMQDLLNYPVFDAGWMTVPRGVGTMIAMFLVGRMVNKIDSRLFILAGFLLTAASLWQMTGYSLYMDSWPIIFAGVVQGFGLGLTFVPLNLLALSNLPAHIMSQGTAIRSLTRMLGGSIGISILQTQLVQNTQIAHSRLVETLRPDNPLVQGHFLAPNFSLTVPSGIAALNAEVTRQAAMISYNDAFALMMIVVIASLPILLLIRVPRRQQPIGAND